MSEVNNDSDVYINWDLVKVPTEIKVDGTTYPINNYNIKVVKEYWDTYDRTVLNKLTTISLAI